MVTHHGKGLILAGTCGSQSCITVRKLRDTLMLRAAKLCQPRGQSRECCLPPQLTDSGNSLTDGLITSVIQGSVKWTINSHYHRCLPP